MDELFQKIDKFDIGLAKDVNIIIRCNEKKQFFTFPLEGQVVFNEEVFEYESTDEEKGVIITEQVGHTRLSNNTHNLVFELSTEGRLSIICNLQHTLVEVMIPVKVANALVDMIRQVYSPDTNKSPVHEQTPKKDSSKDESKDEKYGCDYKNKCSLNKTGKLDEKCILSKSKSKSGYSCTKKVSKGGRRHRQK